MLRRAGIAQAIVNEPELLLLDEPTAGLDPEQRVAFRALLRDLGQRATVVVSTHLVEDVGAACTQVALMDRGKLVFHGTPADLAARGGGYGTGDTPLAAMYASATMGNVGSTWTMISVALFSFASATALRNAGSEADEKSLG